MKSAQDWARRIAGDTKTPWHELVEQIQLDARNSALKEAAEVAGKRYDDPAWSVDYQNASSGISQAILSLIKE